MLQLNSLGLMVDEEWSVTIGMRQTWTSKFTGEAERENTGEGLK